MSDTTEPITLQAYDPGDLLMDANARSNAQATVTKADVALCKTIAASRPDGCGNNVPITIVRRPDGRLRVRTGRDCEAVTCEKSPGCGRSSSRAADCPMARQNPSRPRPFGLPSASASHPRP